MRITGAVIKEQGVTFGVVLMRRTAFANVTSRRQFHATAQGLPMFRGIPLVVAAQDHRGRTTYWGRHDLVRFLGSLLVEQLPWKEYTLDAA